MRQSDRHHLVDVHSAKVSGFDGSFSMPFELLKRVQDYEL